MIRLHTTLGDIDLELDEAKAPETSKNFLAYVKSGHYSDTVFHRVIDGFMIQGGGFEPGMKQKPTQPPVKNEANNGLKNKRHTIAMDCRKGDEVGVIEARTPFRIHAFNPGGLQPGFPVDDHDVVQ